MMRYATYITNQSVDGNGTFYFPSCCKYWIYSVKDEMAYHGKYCPKCFWENRHTTLFREGSIEALKYCKE